MSDQNQEQQMPQFDIVRVYSKDASLETPNSPTIFQKEWKPQLKIEFDSKTTPLENDQYEVALRVTVTCEVEDTTAFICEVNQAAIFIVKNVPADTLEYLLGATAPNIIFPYAREHISNLVGRATFPQLNLAPLNFEAIYRAKKAQQAQQEEKSEPEETQA